MLGCNHSLELKDTRHLPRENQQPTSSMQNYSPGPGTSAGTPDDLDTQIAERSGSLVASLALLAMPVKYVVLFCHKVSLTFVVWPSLEH